MIFCVILCQVEAKVKTLFYFCTMIYPANFETKIGFDSIRKEITNRCLSTLGQKECAQMSFSANYDEVVEQLSRVNEFLSIINEDRDFPLNHYYDVGEWLKSILLSGTYITAERLFDLQRSLKTIEDILAFFSNPERAPYPHLHSLVSDMQSFREIRTQAERVLDKFGNIKDNASPALLELRRQLLATNQSIGGIIRRIMTQGKQNGIIDEETMPSVRDGRLVIPLSPANKRKIRGIVHDESASGKTVFVEPEEIVEANNRIRETEAEINREIIRILTDVADIIRPHIGKLTDTYKILGMLDFIRAKALFAKDIDAQMPHLHHTPVVEWYNARHPALLFALRQQGRQVVPLDIKLDKEQRILLISGPNAGGKSICLKTVGVVQYMTQCGIMPPVYSNSHMGIFHSIFIDIGDQQSLENDLSTYSSHLLSLKTILMRCSGKSLVLIDEFGSGTEPQIGGAIAQAVLEQMNEKKTFGVITTHYHNLKQFAEESEGIVNGAMLYDRQKMTPLFQLSIGYPGSSFALEIARKTGLPQNVVDKAADLVGSDYVNFDKYLLDIVRDRKYWENKRRDIHIKEKKLDALISDYNTRVENIAQEHKAIIRDAKHEAKQIIEQSNAQIEHTIKEIKENQAEKEATKQLREQLKEFRQSLDRKENETPKTLRKVRQRTIKDKKTEGRPPDSSTPLSVGDNVTIKGGNSVGNILEISGKYALVTFGNLKTRVSLADLERTMRKETKPTSSGALSGLSADSRTRQLNFKQEIDVRGMRADEAIQATTYFLDDALQFGIKRVRILHGTGTGVLREVIREHLHATPFVTSYHDEDVRLGGAGITVVDL